MFEPESVTESVGFWLGLMLIAFFLGLIGSAIGKTKARAADGFALGFLLGPLGWILVLLLPSKGPKCPACLGVIPAGARRCKHCGS